jgi:hypothetical protein
VDQQAAVALRRLAAVAPHGRGREPRRQDLLGDLLYRDLVVVGGLAARHGDGGRPWHHRRDEHRGHELGHVPWVERATRDLGGGDRHPERHPGDLTYEEQSRAGAATDAQEIAPRHS